jgi:hypothetical protein
MHNWSGNYENLNPRQIKKKTSCGRPFAPEITVRAGGVSGKTAAVVPCCQTLGPPNETKSVLGHLDTQTFEEVYFGEKYNKLREAHSEEKFDDIDYCKNCDFLYQSKEVIAWTNDSSARINNMLGTGEDFILTDFNKNRTWSNCPVRFVIDNDHGDLITMIQRSLIQYYVDRDFAKGLTRKPKDVIIKHQKEIS